MAEITSGPHRILSLAPIYSGFQNLLGARRFREKVAKEELMLFPKARVLDLGCGTADILEVLPNDIQYFGIDRNPHYIASAEKRFGTRGTFYLKDLTEIGLLEEKFDRIILTGVLHHLDDQDAKALIAKAGKLLEKDGLFLAIENVLIPRQNLIAKFLIENDRGQNVRDEGHYKNLFEGVFRNVNSHIRHNMLRVPYTHIILQAREPSFSN